MICKFSNNVYKIGYNFYEHYYLIYLSEMEDRDKYEKFCYICNYQMTNLNIISEEIVFKSFDHHIKRHLYNFPSCIYCFELFVLLTDIGFVFNRVEFLNRIRKSY